MTDVVNSVADLLENADDDMTMDEAKDILREHGYDPDQVAQWGHDIAADAIARAKRAELQAWKDAIPVDDLWRLYNDFPYRSTEFVATFEQIFEWLHAQPEVQP